MTKLQTLRTNTLVDKELSKAEHLALRRLLIEISSYSKQLPSTAFIGGVTCRQWYPVAGGAFADIYHGDLGSSKVALKRLRIFGDVADPANSDVVIDYTQHLYSYSFPSRISTVNLWFGII